jgi:glycosyltransferase involved in cell wall biosynthesis
MTIQMTYGQITSRAETHPYTESIEISIYGQRSLIPDISFVTPVFNKEKSLPKFLNNFDQYKKKNIEVILINDSSTDNSLAILNDWAKKQSFAVTILNVTKPIFETACDNLGFALSKGNIVCELQADIYLEDKLLLDRVQNAFANHSFSSLSSRCGHSWSAAMRRRYSIANSLIRPTIHRDKKLFAVGRMNEEIFNDKLLADLDTIYFSDTNNRGPLFFHGNDIRKKLLRCDLFFLGNDDHHYNLTASTERQLRAAYLPAQIYSIREEGSTRQKRNGNNALIYNWLNKNKAGDKLLNKKLLLKKPSQIQSMPLNVKAMSK